MVYRFLMICIFLFIFPVTNTSESKYFKDFYDSGQPKSEGWLKDGKKTGYWKFYYANGLPSKQGHYENDRRAKYWYFYSPERIRIKEGNYLSGEMSNWWLFYDTKGRINHKCQLNKGKKNGYCLKYENEELVSAEKYRNGEKIKEWFNFVDFRRENKLSDLK
jgi:antitoxin component YwqK of YwqJK toxin-antitoxin module